MIGVLHFNRTLSCMLLSRHVDIFVGSVLDYQGMSEHRERIAFLSGDEIALVSEVSLPLPLPIVYVDQNLHDIKKRVQLRDSSNYFSVMEVTVAAKIYRRGGRTTFLRAMLELSPVRTVLANNTGKWEPGTRLWPGTVPTN